MNDPTEPIRRAMVNDINNQVETNNPDEERQRLEELYGEVWDTNGVWNNFEVTGFMAPFCLVKRKSDGKKGTLAFQHRPRFYFNFVEV